MLRRRGTKGWTVPGVVGGFGVAVVGLLLACGDGGTEPVIGGSFSASVVGDLQRTLSGTAVFGVETIGGNQGFVIAMQRGNSAALDVDLILLGRFNTTRPVVGDYNVISGACQDCSANDFDGGYVYQRPDGASGFFVSESGSVTVTKSVADTVAGTCTFIARSATNPEFMITITASFTAVPGTIPDVPGT